MEGDMAGDNEEYVPNTQQALSLAGNMEGDMAGDKEEYVPITV